VPFDLVEWSRHAPRLNTIATIAAALAVLPVPDLYFLFLRVLFCGVSLFYMTRPTGLRDADRWVLTGLVVFFNPIVPVDFISQRLWQSIVAGTVVYFWVLRWRSARAQRLRWRR
jgi:hypothetical protein